MPGFPMPPIDPAEAGLRVGQLERLVALIERHVADGRYPGCQIAVARHGRLALDRTFGQASVGSARRPAGPDTLWLLYSNTKVVTAAALWLLAERGLFRFTDRISEHLPEFARYGKQDVTVLQLLTHQAGFPNAVMPPEAWEDRTARRETVSGFTLEWTPGSRVVYHPLAAHWVAAALIDALSGQDFREFIRAELIEPLGLSSELHIGLPESQHGRAADMHEPGPDGGVAPLAEANAPAWRRAGVPGGGGYATARAMAAFYQMMLQGGQLGGARVLSPRTLAYAIRNYTGDRLDEYMGMPMHRGLGPHLRGTTATIRGLGAFASPTTFGHGGVGSSYCWGDPESGVSFAYLTNNRIPDPWHSQRLDVVSNLVHAAIL